jgi:hypothetical protein
MNQERTGGTKLARVEKMARGEVPPAPVAQLIGFQLTSVKQGKP